MHTCNMKHIGYVCLSSIEEHCHCINESTKNTIAKIHFPSF